MTKRIYRAICLVALVVFISSVILFLGVLYDYFSDAQQKQLAMQANLAAQGVNHEGMAYLTDFEATDCRITWIGTDGSVLYDSISNRAEMENHLEREEVIEALSTGYGQSRRYSATLMERSLYAARRLADGSVIRLSLSQSSILTLLFGMMQPICMIFAAAVVSSILLAIRVSKKIVSPLNAIDLDHPLSNEGYDELSPLLRRLDHQQRQLRQQEVALSRKQNELDTIIGSMNEGMVLLNQRGEILSINHAAMELLDTTQDCVREDMLTVNRNLALHDILLKALRGEQATQLIELHGGCYQTDANPILSEEKVLGAVLFFFDVTEKEKAEQTRREFTANVSHELKSPLHVISGYAELLKNNLVKAEDVAPFAGKIYDEAGRMIQLIEDIISLSHLDEGAGDDMQEHVNLYELAQNALQSLGPRAAGSRIHLELSGETVFLTGIPRLLYSIIYNLCDNAIKYNREDGSVTVNIWSEETYVFFSVRDTGIGIPPEHKEHIFERFYRVDKSHSKEVGGTGLGLSIVKHAARIHHAAIEVDSAVGEGTTVTLRFPRQRVSASRNAPV